MPLEHALQQKKRFQRAGPWKSPVSQSGEIKHPLFLDTVLPRQHYLKAKRTPIRFNVMVTGETGLGKKTFINTLFQTDIFDTKQDATSIDHESLRCVTVRPVTCILEEEGVRMLLTAIDTPGFGDKCDRRKDLEPVLQYIDDQYRIYFEAESGIEFRETRNQHDTRVHLCFYFIAPTGQNLKELDLVSLQALSPKVNLIPLVAKADTLTNQERLAFKKRVQILMELKNHKIKIYPIDYPNKDRVDLNFKSHIPFCVIGSNDMITVNGKQVRGREYSYGNVLVENPCHCDIFKLREMLMGYLLHELGDLTHDLFYRLYRTQFLRKGKKTPRPESLLPCDDEYDVKISEFESILQIDMRAKEEKIKEEYLEKVRCEEVRLHTWEQELTRKRQELDEDLTRQYSQLEQIRLLLDQQDQYQNQWKIKFKPTNN